MNIAVIQYWTSNLKYSPYTERVNWDYCVKHGYKYVVEKDDSKIIKELEGRSATWFKPKFVLEVLKEDTSVDAILFLDADAILVENVETKIETFNEKHQDSDIICTEDHGPSRLNAGVLILKNTDFVKDFMKKWWEVGETLNGGTYKTSLWHDQTCFSHLIDTDYNKCMTDKKIKIIENSILNERVLVNGMKNNLVFHAFSYGHFPKRTIDESVTLIEKRLLSEKFKLAIVYHCYLVGNWKEIVSLQLTKLKTFGLYEAADIFKITVNFDERTCVSHEQQLQAKREFGELIEKIFIERRRPSHFMISYFTDNKYEYPGIKTVKDLGDAYPNLNILYFHSKGVYNTFADPHQRLKISSLKIQNVEKWREMMEFFLIERWKDCVEFLSRTSPETANTIGLTCNNKWYWGNFWWTKSSYIKTNETPERTRDRWYYEAWLNERNSSFTKEKCYEFCHLNFNLYITTLHKRMWMPFSTSHPRSLTKSSSSSKFYILEDSYEKLKIKKAEYGIFKEFIIDEGRKEITQAELEKINNMDVTHLVRKNVELNNMKRIIIPVSNEFFGNDPVYGVRKMLLITFIGIFENKEEEFLVGVDEGEIFELNTTFEI